MNDDNTRELYFATSNKHKFDEAQAVADKYNIKLIHYLEGKGIELRSDDVEEIAADSVRQVYSALRKPVFVEDTGLFIHSLNGFPGTYSSWVYNKIGLKGILALLKEYETSNDGSKNNREDIRSAYFKTAIAFKSAEEERIFEGICKGSIAESIKGTSGFAYDKIFIPEGYNRTFAENIQLKNQLSHRYKALVKLFEYVSRISL